MHRESSTRFSVPIATDREGGRAGLVPKRVSASDQETRDRAERGSVVRGSARASAGARLRARALQTPLGLPGVRQHARETLFCRAQSGELVARILSARHAALNPLSMLTTASPGLQDASIVLSATVPPCATPVPTDVGTPITGARSSPATTAGRAPSIPATTMQTRED